MHLNGLSLNSWLGTRMRARLRISLLPYGSTLAALPRALSARQHARPRRGRPGRRAHRLHEQLLSAAE